MLKFLRYSDVHLNHCNFISKLLWFRHINKENPEAVFITGDISNGLTTALNLEFMAKFVKCRIYICLGNHDLYFGSIENRYNQIRELCKRNKNIIWLSDMEDPIHIGNNIGSFGLEGFYDGRTGNANLLKYTLDWMLISNTRKLSNMEARIEFFRELSDRSCYFAKKKLDKCIELGFKKIFLFTHFPPWKEATRDVGTILSNFWLPFNVNTNLGKILEEYMKNHPNVHLTIFCGHSHQANEIYVADNINCKVAPATYLNSFKNEEHIFI